MFEPERRTVLGALLSFALQTWTPPLRAASTRASERLVLWCPGDLAAALRRVGAAFTLASGVDLQVETPENGQAKFQQTASAGKGPDLAIWPHDRLGEWVAGGLLLPATPRRRMMEDFDPLAWRAVQVGDRHWGWPLAMEAIALVYNRRLMAAPPATWEQVFALDRRLRADGRRAILWEYANPYFTWPLLAAGGGYVFAIRGDGSVDVGDTGVNAPGALAGAQLLERLLREGCMPRGSGYAEMEGAMAQGRVAMMINGPWSWDNLRKAGIDFGVARIPTLAGRRAVPLVGVRTAVINAASPNPELAREFIENHLLAPAGLQTVWQIDPVGVPASRGFYGTLHPDPDLAATFDSIEDGVAMPNLPEMGRFWSAMASALGNLADGRQSPREALDAAARRIRAR